MIVTKDDEKAEGQIFVMCGDGRGKNHLGPAWRRTEQDTPEVHSAEKKLSIVFDSPADRDAYMTASELEQDLAPNQLNFDRLYCSCSYYNV